MKPKEQLVTVDSINIDGMEGYLKDHLFKLETILNKVPEEFRNSVEVSYDTYEDCPYDNTYRTDMTLSYFRPETEEEKAHRVAYNKIVANEEKSRKLAQFEKLKKELGL